jgi:hypothetical protein
MSPGIRRRWVAAAVALLWIAIAAVLVRTVAGETADDFYITYRYAQNLLAGEGFTFNPGERVFGTTAPGWGLALALLAGLSGGPVAVVATVASGLALLAFVGLLAGTGPAASRWPEGVLAGTLVLTSSFLWIHHGSEALAMLAILALAARWAEKRPAAAGLLAGFAVWLRPEAGLAVAAMALWLRCSRRRWPWPFLWTAGAVVAAGLAAAWLYFGTPLPNTLGAKRLQVAWRPEVWRGGSVFWVEGYRWLRESYAGSLMPVLAVGGLVGHGSLLRSGDLALKTLASLSLGLIVAYPLLGVPFYTWYALPVLVALIYGLVFLVGDLGRALWRQRPFFQRGRSVGFQGGARRWAAGILLVAGLVSLAGLTLSTNRRTWVGASRFRGMPQIELYRQAGHWLQEHAGPEEDVAHVEVGALAYFGLRPVRDLLALVSPEYLPFVESRDPAGALRWRPPAYVLDHSRLRGLVREVLEDPWFRAHYQPVASFEASLSAETLVIYQRRPEQDVGSDSSPGPDQVSGRQAAEAAETLPPGRRTNGQE